jgi:amino acid adenylation domain-containing protein
MNREEANVPESDNAMPAGFSSDQKPSEHLHHDGKEKKNPRSMTESTMPVESIQLSGQQRRVAAIWKEMLHSDDVQLQDRFFSLGGHSLNATQILSRVFQAFQTRLSLKSLMDNPTLEQFCKMLPNQLPSTDAPADREATPPPDTARLVLTLTQEELWILHQLDQNKKSRNIVIRCTIHGSMQPPLWQEAFQKVVNQHQALQAIFIMEGQSVSHKIVASPTYTIEVTDLSGQTTDDQRLYLQQEEEKIGDLAFSTSRWPLFAAKLYRLDANQHIFLFSIHHLVFDGWSHNVLLEDLLAHYDLLLGHSGRSNEIAMTYLDACALVRQQQTITADDLAFWRQKLLPVPARLSLPYRQVAPLQPSHKGERIPFQLGHDLVGRLERWTQQQNANLFSGLVALFKVFLYAITRQTDLVVGTPYANRNHPDWENVIGYFTNMVSVRSHMIPQQSLNDFLRTEFQECIEALDHATLPFGKLVQELKIGERQDFNPIYKIIFILQKPTSNDFKSQTLALHSSEIGNHSAKIDLTINIEIEHSGIEAWFEYDTGLFDHGTIQEMTAEYVRWLEFAPAKSDLPIDSMVEMIGTNLYKPQHSSHPIAAHSQRIPITTSSRPASFLLIGETSLLIQCARLVKEMGYDIVAVVSPDPLVIKWAQTENIPIHNRYAQLTPFLQQFTFDFLLSIVNSAILKDDVLRMPRIAAINYHDAPLPAYAGVYATSWAILNGETRHGVTWHIMTAVADEGDIVAQEILEVSAFDTVQMLNAQCYEAAIRTFKSILKAVTEDALYVEAQDLSRRSYFGLYQRPDKAGVLDFNDSSESLLNLIRALGFGTSYQNPFGAAWLLIEQQVYLVKSAAPGGQRPGSRPGEIVDITDESIVVATQTGAVQIQGLTDLYGHGVTIPFVQKQHQLRPGMILTLPSEARLKFWGQKMSELARHEKYWLKELVSINATDSGHRSELTNDKRVKLDYTFNATILNAASDYGQGFLPAAIALFDRCLDPDSGAIGLVHQGTLVSEWSEFGLSSPVVPLSLAFSADSDMAALLQAGQQTEKIIGRQTYLVDLYSRYPELHGKKPLTYSTIVVLEDVVSAPPSIPLDHANAVVLHVLSTGLRVYTWNSRRQATDRMISRLLAFLSYICSHGFERLEQIPLLLPHEQSLVHAELTKTSPYTLRPVPLLFAEQVKNYPQQIAVQQDGQSLTYQELNQLVDRLAARLQQQEMGANRCIGLCMHRSPGLIAAILAILKCGASYVPMDAKYPKTRISQIIQDADIKQIIVSEDLAGLFDREPVTTMIFEHIGEHATDALEPVCTLSDTAYVIFTSGSTGKPKGVMIGHEALAQFTLDCMDRYDLGPGDHVLQFASISFDAAVEEIFPCLSSGATLVLRTDEWLSSIPNFIRECSNAGITILDLPTAFWNVMIHECSAMQLRLPACVRVVIIGGELATDATFSAWKQLCGSHPVLYNTYGPTETTVVASHFQYGSEWQHPFLPIGKSRDGVHAVVLNRFGQLMPPEHAGELYLGGSCLAQGYIHNEVLTSQAFQQKTVLGNALRLYKTGDYVRQRHDGNLLFVGRKDDQVKIRGFRIELEEIKTAVCSLTDIKDCVITTYGEGTDKKLAAYIVLTQTTVRVDTVRQQLRAKLPDYMMPAVFIPMEAIPLTVNMKADVRALPSPANFEKKTVAESKQEIFSPIERSLQQIWQTVLEQAAIGADQDFFDLGGDSLRAVRIMTMVEKEMGRSLPISVLFRYSTIRQLALLIESKDEELRWRALVQIKEGHGKVPLFIIHGAGLNILLFNTLAKHMDADQPIYGLQARHMDGQGKPLDNLEQIVHEYAQEMLNVLPNGPFALAGFSIGGLIAFELAQYFRRHDKPVVFLGVFDTYAFSKESSETSLTALLAWGKHTILKIWFNTKIIVRYPGEVIPKKWRWLRYRMNLKKNRSAEIKDQELMNLPEKLRSIAAAIITAVDNNKLEWYPSAMHLFRAERRLFYVPETEFLGWKKYAEKVIVHRIPGDHSYIFAPPNDMEFAQVLQAALDDETRRMQNKKPYMRSQIENIAVQ